MILGIFNIFNSSAPLSPGSSPLGGAHPGLPHGTMKEGTDEATPLVPKDGEALKRLAVLASCVGFLADSYDLFTIDLVVLILELHYGEALISAKSKALMVSTMLFGVVAGQLLFGALADRWGRKWTFVSTAGLTVFSCLDSALCGDGDGQALPALPVQLALCRFVLGCGVGGEYPLSATVAWRSPAPREEPAEIFVLGAFSMMQVNQERHCPGIVLGIENSKGDALSSTSSSSSALLLFFCP